jgi:hypothetical protein
VSSGSPSVTILAHRGWWRGADEKNTLIAVERAFAGGFGIEIDIRDRDGALAVAHDVEEPGAYPFELLSPLLARFPGLCLALNVKSCGLQDLIAETIKAHGIRSYFTFDMAVPDLIGNIRAGLTSFTRQSEIEPEPILYAQAQGVWIDMFEREWVTAALIRGHLQNGKDIALVSPELHGRPYLKFWQYLKDRVESFREFDDRTLYICTDHPEEAASFLNG